LDAAFTAARLTVRVGQLVVRGGGAMDIYREAPRDGESGAAEHGPTGKARRFMDRQAMLQLWEQARQIDPTLKVSPRQFAPLRCRQLRPVSFSRDLLFSSMARGEPILVDDLPVPVHGEELGVGQAVRRAMREGFPRNRKVRIRCGPSSYQKQVVVEELLRRWTGGRARVSVTDMHIRGTNVMRNIDCARLSDFNLLAETRGAVGDEEMLTMVVSSAGALTDSHSDDPDGSNHCFVGRKLWLVWDTFLGLSRNLEDVERCDVFTCPSFSISRFLSIPRSRWFVVESGQTLFLPGHLTHKVLTLEDYLGVGSFFVMLPSYLRTLARWTRHTPLWALNDPADRRLELVDRITRRVIDKVKLLAFASEQERSRWGIAHLHSAVRDWQRTASARARGELLGNPTSAKLLRCVLDPAAADRRITRKDGRERPDVRGLLREDYCVAPSA
jgi:hypothetical protein